MAMNPILSTCARAAPSAACAPACGKAGPAAEGGFMRIVNDLVGQANVQQVQADQAIQSLVTGCTEDIHNVALSVANADLTFRLLLEIRNRLTEAYQEIIRMQV